MAILVGIDEAGYGPILGPLVITSTALWIPDEILKQDLWKLLGKAVGKKKSSLSGRLLITDSKKAYSKSTGISHLRRTTLSAIAAMYENSYRFPNTAGALLSYLCPDCVNRLNEYPWYKTISKKDLCANQNDIQIAAGVLRSTLAGRGIKLLNISTRCLDVGYYNRMVDVVKNKASVLFTAISELIQNAFDNIYDSSQQLETVQDLQIIIDRQGGRVSYRPVLSRMFPDLELSVIRRNTSVSSYELKGSKRTMRLHFPVKADQKYLPVSLSSMISKYVRELMVSSINQYFLQFHTDLKPTAGYWTDGKRFIKDIQTNVKRVSFDSRKLIRLR